MISSIALDAYLQDLLACQTYQDYAPNGLQIQGKAHIQTICTAVTASLETIQEASRLNADALIVHHGFFWRGESLTLTGMKHQRVKTLIMHDMNLLAYHLPLDCHPTLGNNACIAELLHVESVTQHPAGQTKNLLWSGKYATPITALQLEERLSNIFNRKPQTVLTGENNIQQIAWCSGAAQDFIGLAHAMGADAYISGEISERTYYEAKELGIHYFGAGHHATERHGIQALGLHLANTFNLNHHFIDTNNPI